MAINMALKEEKHLKDRNQPLQSKFILFIYLFIYISVTIRIFTGGSLGLTPLWDGVEKAGETLLLLKAPLTSILFEGHYVTALM